ncbi:hypothetical protein PV10_04200 [Exophiala mesophila]|uniref:Chitin synthase export chaperone n=1 Tax=Exophiala mesophila TaxID=212818 RepID=A0A0D1ZGL0_EXOME|nr:uncharacterized protein PV10_04200 [Exophiala mesophila]KIV92949.1 hypothetical protein PV10_04200 [Exophiala mesophila]
MGFGDFASICEQAALPQCYLLGSPSDFTSDNSPVLLPACSARSIELGNTIIFQAATDFAHIAALAMTAIMIFHVRSKFTAVGRREILTFFYIYSLLTIISLVLDAGVIPATSSGAFPWFVAAQNGLASALCTSLVINGFVGFQLYEDGTTLSVWLLRLTSLVMFIITFAVSLLTFRSWAGLSPTNTIGLFIVLYVINAIFLAVYFVMQVVLVVNTLQDRWPLGDLGFGALFFIVGQVILYVFARKICEQVSHYLDGLFFATVLNLLAVMMVYKYWDSITKEDLEFSVGTKQGHWDVKDPLLDPNDDYRTSVYGGGRDSLYDNGSLDYVPPVPNHPATTRDYYPNMTTTQMEPKPGGPLNYGDIRQQIGSYEEFDPQPQPQPPNYDRNRQREYSF